MSNENETDNLQPLEPEKQTPETASQEAQSAEPVLDAPKDNDLTGAEASPAKPEPVEAKTTSVQAAKEGVGAEEGPDAPPADTPAHVASSDEKPTVDPNAAVTEGEVGQPAKKIPPKKSATVVEGDAAASPAKESAAPSGEAAPAKKVPPKAAAAPPPPPPELGLFGKQLETAALAPEPLANDAGGIETIGIAPANLVAVCTYLKDAAQFDLLVSIAGVDWKDRLEAVYHLYSTHTYKSLALKVTADNERIPSITSIWLGADWHEREAYDLYGILFEGHPDLKRILMPADWIGHPMRKDYVVDDPRLVWNER